MAAHPATVVRTPGVLREAPATGPLASPGVARLVGFFPLPLFGALQWANLLNPKADGAMLLGRLRAPPGRPRRDRRRRAAARDGQRRAPPGPRGGRDRRGPRPARDRAARR